MPDQATLSLQSPSTLALILANLVPLLGVLFWHWAVAEIMLLFWAESAIIGVLNLAKMVRVGGMAVVALGPFFVVHYGGFMAGHLVFIYALFMEPLPAYSSPEEIPFVLLKLWPALLALGISHTLSFVLNFLGRQEYRNMQLNQQMTQPYKRIVVMHLTLLLGGFLSMVLASPLPALILMLGMKLLVDIRAHLAEHRALTPSESGP